MQIIPKQRERSKSSSHPLDPERRQASWVRQEWGWADLGDQRLNQRLCALAESFAGQPEASIPQATGDWGSACAAHRFFDTEKVTMSNILESHHRSTLERAREQSVILAVQDTTWLNFSTHPQTQGLGPLGGLSEKTIGMLLHTTLALSVEGLPLGVIDAQSWAGEGVGSASGKRRDRRPIGEKESVNWLKSFAATEQVAQQ